MAKTLKKKAAQNFMCWRCHKDYAVSSPPTLYCQSCLDFYKETGCSTVLDLQMREEVKKDKLKDK